jgi:hypothetical protein
VSEEINLERRCFFAIIGITIAAAQFGMIASAAGQSADGKPAIAPT